MFKLWILWNWLPWQIRKVAFYNIRRDVWVIVLARRVAVLCRQERETHWQVAPDMEMKRVLVLSSCRRTKGNNWTTLNKYLDFYNVRSICQRIPFVLLSYCWTGLSLVAVCLSVLWLALLKIILDDPQVPHSVQGGNLLLLAALNNWDPVRVDGAPFELERQGNARRAGEWHFGEQVLAVPDLTHLQVN